LKEERLSKENIAMAFSDFVYPDLLTTFGLAERTVPNLFSHVPMLSPSNVLRDTLAAFIPLATTAHSESARSIWLVGPVLGDLWTRYQGELNLIAGVDFEADPAARLTGRCDFVLSRGPQRSVIGPPVLLVFEAKRDCIPDGLAQCIAAMVGAQRYNLRRNTLVNPIYGCVTTGSLWKFMELSGTNLNVDLNEYTISQLDNILGILVHMVGPIPETAAA
jgi:hypothetical protein